jgi:Pyridoxamine 5'-phosphate oxidase
MTEADRASPTPSALALEILSRRLIANLATLNENGTVHLVAMWFRFEEGRVLLPTSSRTRKIRNLRARPVATIMVDESRAGLDLRGVMLVGATTVLDGPDTVAINRPIHLKYVTAVGLALPDVGRYLGTDDVTISLVPDRITTWDLASTPGALALARRDLALPLDA